MILTLEEAKEWLRVDYDEDDTLINTLIKAAEMYLYNATGNTFDDTNEQAKLLCMVLVMDWYENREMNNFRVGEKVRFIVDSMMAQLSHCYGKDVEGHDVQGT